MVNNWKIYLLAILLFVVGVGIEIYFSGLFFQKPTIDILLLLLIILFFIVSPRLIFPLILIKGLIFDSLSGIGWGIHLISLLVTFLFGYYLLTEASKETLISKFIIGSLMIIVYFSVLEFLNILWLHNSFNLLIIIDLFVNICVYTIIMLVYAKIKAFFYKKT